jgi:hypothetical protein
MSKAVRGQKVGDGDDWIPAGGKKDKEARQRIEKRRQVAKETEEQEKEKEKERLKEEAEKNSFLVGVKVDRTLKYAEFDEIVRRSEAAEKKERMVHLLYFLVSPVSRKSNKKRTNKRLRKKQRRRRNEENKNLHKPLFLLQPRTFYKRYPQVFIHQQP